MSTPATSEAVSRAFHDACLAELDALKPGNVHRFADGHGMSVADFEKSAAAAAPAIGITGFSVGERIEYAVQATRGVVSHNTNLGIILLAAPLAQAALDRQDVDRQDVDRQHVDRQDIDLRGALAQVLNSLTVEDAQAAYRAILMAEPGALGEVPDYDVSKPPLVTLLNAMEAAERRDRIAWNYTHGFTDIFDLGLKWLEGGRMRWGDVPWLATYVYLGFLAHIPDTLIERKFGSRIALEVRDEARPIEAGLSQCPDPQDMEGPIAAFDASLKERGLNPGTTADVTVATLFAASLQ